MFVDARRLDDNSTIEADVCIVGGGAAGITLALQFDKKGIRTCVVESGGFRPDRATRDLYRGESIGIPYGFADGCRSRFLGGSSNCWGGWCRPLDEHDFERRPWINHSGWPFEKSELRPYYDRSRDILKLGPNRYDTDFWVAAIDRTYVRRIPFATGAVVDKISQFSPPLRFGHFYRNDLARSTVITVLLHANAVDIEVERDGPKVRAIKVATLTGRTARVTATIFVLAAGGIENPRLLLASNKIQPAGLGNENDLVGRFFMDHVQLFSGQIRFRAEWARNKLYDEKYSYHSRDVAAYDTCVAGQLMLAPHIQQRERLLNAQMWFSSTFPGEHSATADALIRLRRRVGQRAVPASSISRDLLAVVAHPIVTTEFIIAKGLSPRLLFRVGPRLLFRGCTFHAIVEPLPDPESRVTLSDQRDRLGMNRVQVNWRLDSLVKRTFDRTITLIARELSNAGVADVSLDPPIGDGEWPDTFGEEGAWHHIGTTRMHDSAKFGVVDRHSRVHGVKNLYVSGSSVFPTAGGNFPTITIVALALRLADHIAEQLSVPLSGVLGENHATRAR